ncbi:hypothetical protein BgiBS90_019197 [Biomphalaria glabrata]|nr:hypothetical protein BgiBS90_019197 [Biomphalaria glabrata]
MLIHFFLCLLFLPSDQKPHIDKLFISSGDTFQVTCNSLSFVNGPAQDNANSSSSSGSDQSVSNSSSSDATYILVLTLFRRTLSDTYFQVIANYSVEKESLPQSYVQNNRRWAVSFSGANDAEKGVGNLHTIQVTMTVKEACCSDAGLYRCSAKLSNGTVLASSVSDLTCKDLLKYGAQTKALLTDGRTKFTCVIISLLNLTVDWYFDSLNSRKQHVYRSAVLDINSEGPVPYYDCFRCKEYLYMSTLTFTLTEEEKSNNYFCTGNTTGKGGALI